MIKYFQKLRAKKGFTLVELIVVIAIIGVLAAILIPTMLGYVTQSKVTSANSTAASIKNEVDAWLTNLDTIDKGMKKGAANVAVLKFNVGSGVVAATGTAGEWTAANSDNSQFNDKTNWNGGTTTATTSKGDADHLLGLAADLKSLFPEIKNGAVACYLKGAKCMGVIYTNGTNTSFPTVSWATSSTWPEATAWNNDTQGIAADGSIVGTAPVIQHAGSTTTGCAGFAS
ncbi:MAG: DUF5021 domain-containing protein [Ruminiclostridium sp.]|nr:DUF5021 domain-containing protein [Ruminiclostridium sp.]